MKKLKAAAFSVLCLILALVLPACNCGGDSHTHVYTQTVTAPTCIKQGYTTFICECGRSYKSDYTEPLGHNFEDNKCTRCGYTKHTHEYEKTVIAPTCTEQGYTQGKCKICGATYTAYYKEPLGHDYVDDKCTRCGDIRHDHNYDKTVIAPTCTERGYTVYKCTLCEQSFTADFTEPLGHDYVDGKCTRCDDFFTTVLYYTFSEDGTYLICQGISNSISTVINDVVIPSTFEGYPVKEIADEAFSYNGGLKSVVIPDSVTAIGNKAFYFCLDLKSITIGKGVTTIGDSAFQNCSNLTSVTLPDSVTSIGEWAFAICSKLQSVQLPEGITQISEYSFYNCYNLTNIDIPYSVTTICPKAFYSCGIASATIPHGVTSIGESAFAHSQMSEITIPVSVTSIGDNAFYSCLNLKNIYYTGTKQQWSAISKGKDWDLNVGNWEHSNYTLHCTDDENRDDSNKLEFIISDDGSYYICNGISKSISAIISDVVIPSTFDGYPVKEIGVNAFNNCNNITSVSIPQSVNIIGESAFAYCTNLSDIKIDNGVTAIGLAAFRACNIKSIIIPDSVTKIGDYAFYGCNKLESITIPSGVTEFNSYTFTSCTALKDINFKGTTARWQSIRGSSWFFMSTKCTVHCTDGDIVQQPYIID